MQKDGTDKTHLSSWPREWDSEHREEPKRTERQRDLDFLCFLVLSATVGALSGCWVLYQGLQTWVRWETNSRNMRVVLASNQREPETTKEDREGTIEDRKNYRDGDQIG